MIFLNLSFINKLLFYIFVIFFLVTEWQKVNSVLVRKWVIS